MTSANMLILLFGALPLMLGTSTSACQFKDEGATIDVFYQKAATVFTAHLVRVQERSDYKSKLGDEPLFESLRDNSR